MPQLLKPVVSLVLLLYIFFNFEFKKIYIFFQIYHNHLYTINAKTSKPQVSEAVALPQIYADLIQHKGLFKYYITHF